MSSWSTDSDAGEAAGGAAGRPGLVAQPESNSMQTANRTGAGPERRVGREKEVGGEIPGGGVEVDKRVGVFEKFAVPGFTNGGRFNEFVDHVGGRNDWGRF